MFGNRSHHVAVILLVVLSTTAALMVPEAAFAISNPPYVGLGFDPESTKPLNILAGGSATFGMSAFVNLNWDEGNISLTAAHAPWVNVTITPNLLTGITGGDYYNSRMAVKIAQDAPEGLTTIAVHANAVLIMDINGSRHISRLENTKNIMLNLMAVPVRTITVTTTVLSQHELPPTTVTTTVSTTLTNTVTNISTEQVTDPSTYAWAVGATAIAAVLAVIILRKKT